MRQTLKHALTCPLTGKTMQNPVILAGSGWSYEHDAVAEWIETHGTEPRTGAVLDSPASRRLIVNVQLREFIADMKKAAVVK